MKSGFVAVVGKPNSGKSTLINALIGRKISIVSEKPQTTRFKLRGILTLPEAQIVFVDTPGFHQPKDALGQYLNSQVTGTIKEVDLVLFLVDASSEITDEDRQLADEIKKSNLPCLVVLTKKDLCLEEQIEEARKSVEQMLTPNDWISLSAVEREGLDELILKIISFLPEGPALYPEDMVTDYPLTIQAAEIVREKVLTHTYQEVPHSVAVEILRIEERPEKNLLEIYAEIYVEKDSQKKIVIGKEGSMIKKIGTEARQELEFLTGKKIFLDLHVKVKEKWREKESFVKKIYRS
ncbi:MAG: GTPase Era [Candidatus Aminicenantes bacterium]|nr:GTPase Era [Candidatus Aminicenantes bacterium]